MDVRTYRARSMHEALRLVRHDLGPEAAVLGTREMGRGLLGWFRSGMGIEVTASADVNVPSRLQASPPALPSSEAPSRPAPVTPPPLPAHTECYRQRFRAALKQQGDQRTSLVEELAESKEMPAAEMPESYFRLFAALLDAEMSDQIARQLVDRLYIENGGGELTDIAGAKSRLAQMVQSEINVTGPLLVTPGECRIVALVGPTGVGKTTTIAKLAANYRLREKCRVGLITVDTYRIAAIDQLRTYADIIDLPMEVVTTPRQMREAIARMDELDLVLLDTAGRSPHDEVRIGELRSMLGEASPSEVHLVLSAVGSTRALVQASQRFADVGATALVLTKLDEAASLGNLLALFDNSQLPVSYVTDGQNVPDDIRPADAGVLAQSMFSILPVQ